MYGTVYECQAISGDADPGGESALPDRPDAAARGPAPPRRQASARPGAGHPGRHRTSRRRRPRSHLDAADRGPLGVGAMTLYGYVADRDALLAHMINEVAAEIRAARPPLRQLARADLDLVARRGSGDTCPGTRGFGPASGTLPFLIAPRLLTPAELVLAALEPLGIDLQTAGAALRLLQQLRRRYHLARNRGTHSPLAPRHRGPPVERWRPISSSSPPAATTAHEQARPDRARRQRPHRRPELLDLGLQCLLDGIGALIAQHARPCPAGQPGPAGSRATRQQPPAPADQNQHRP